ncbi:hypothetical protein [Chryseobacterium lineare]
MKKICIYFLLVFLTHNFYSQQTVGNNQLDRQVLDFPTSPDAYSLSKVGKLPMDLFNGKANINIPIYSVRIGGLDFPIGLSYNTGGIKQNEIASSVGLGWALSMPNSISKNIFDKDDDFSPLFFHDINHATNTLAGFDIFDNTKQADMDLLSSGQYDLKPDLYMYNLPGLSGNFIVNNNIGYTIPHEDIKIEKVSPGFTITDTQGNRYWLSYNNQVFSKSTGQAPQLSMNQMSLDSLRTSNGDILKFEYQKVQKYTEKTVYEKRYIYTIYENYTPTGYEEFPTLNPSPPDVINTENNTENLISKIIFPEGEISFLYSGDENLLTTSDAMYRKDLNSSVGGKALKRVIVKNKGGKIIKQISLTHSYFESASLNKTYEDYRLKLTEVIDDLNGSKHSFTYNEQYPLIRRNGNSDDLWGYFNSNITSGSNIPFVYGSNSTIIGGSRDRGVNAQYTQMGVLTKVKYPTGAEKKLYYENNDSGQTSTHTEYHTETIDGIDSDVAINPNELSVTKTVTIDPALHDVKVHFSNGCLNNTDPQTFPSGGDYSSCRGFVTVGSITNNYHVTQEIPVNNTGQPIQLKLTRFGDCGCSLSISHGYTTSYTQTTNQLVGGLRIKQIEDIDNNNVSNIFYYDYNNSGTLKRKFSFYKPYYRVAEPRINVGTPDPDVGYIAPADYVTEIKEYQSSGNAFTSYNSGNIMTYSKVTERNGLGEIIHIFTNDNQLPYSPYSNTTVSYTDWRNGLPLTTIYKKGSDTLRKEVFHYEFNPLKNPKAGFIVGNPDEMAFGMDLFMVKYHNSHGLAVNLANYEMSYYPLSIYGGAIEKKQSKTTEYFKNNKVVETVTDYTYSDTDINKPINLISAKNTYKDGSFDVTGYTYAHDQGNQLMIDRNMIGIPLETTTTQTIGGTTKTLGKTKTIYPTSLPTAQTGNLVLPTSTLSYDLQFPTVVSAEILYDKYDSKGHPLQYTTKDGISTAIIWGYNNTQPIAKITGAKLSDISLPLINTIVSASDSDASAIQNNDELAFLTELNNFRNHSSMAGYQITTYTYDPLIGVRSITPPSGIKEVYLYDSAKRLMEIREDSQTGKLLKEFKYNYKN